MLENKYQWALYEVLAAARRVADNPEDEAELDALRAAIAKVDKLERD